MSRISWDEYFLKLAMLAAERSTCLRHHVGAIIVKDRRVLSTGYNGAVSGEISCLEEGFCLRNKLNIPSGQRHEICKAVHAEQNAIIQVGSIDMKGSTMYCTHSPCIICAKMIVNAGINRLVTYSEYADKDAVELIKRRGVEFIKLAQPDNTIIILD